MKIAEDIIHQIMKLSPMALNKGVCKALAKYVRPDDGALADILERAAKCAEDYGNAVMDAKFHIDARREGTNDH